MPGLHTKDLLSESKLSREMLKGSFSHSRLLWFEEVVDVFDLECQKDGFWGGDGWSNGQHVLRCIMCDPPQMQIRRRGSWAIPAGRLRCH